MFCRKPLSIPKNYKRTCHFISLTVGVGHTTRSTYESFCCKECTVDDTKAKQVMEEVWEEMKRKLRAIG